MKVLAARVDALTLAYRVRLDPGFVAALKARSDVAREHGRASFRWGVLVPADGGAEVAARGGKSPDRDRAFKSDRLGPFRAKWGVGTGVERVERRTMIWGELRFSRALKVWNLTNEGHYRMRIDVNAPGGNRLDPSGLRDVRIVSGAVEAGELGDPSDPGFTLEIVWYAQALAERGARAAIEESDAIAALTGDVLEKRLRRFDLAADVEGWAIEEGDVDRLVKRPRARWAKEYTIGDEGDDRERASDRGATTHARESGPRLVGSSGAERRLTGINVGRGGNVMARIYDKRAELEQAGERRDAEEERWIAAGWSRCAACVEAEERRPARCDKCARVTRVEFQIRGEAIRELGLRDPDCCLETFAVGTVKRPGKRRKTVREQRIATVTVDGVERQATFTDRLDSVWGTCLDWMRLVQVEYTRTGRLRSVSRAEDDPRWALLRTVRFEESLPAVGLRRFRPRAAASSAQALGVTLSQAAKEGALSHWNESPGEYADHPAPLEVLRERVRRLKLDETERIVDWLLERCGDPVSANVHLAIRANAARDRFMRPGMVSARPPPEPIGWAKSFERASA